MRLLLILALLSSFAGAQTVVQWNPCTNSACTLTGVTSGHSVLIVYWVFSFPTNGPWTLTVADTTSSTPDTFTSLGNVYYQNTNFSLTYQQLTAAISCSSNGGTVTTNNTWASKPGSGTAEYTLIMELSGAASSGCVDQQNANTVASANPVVGVPITTRAGVLTPSVNVGASTAAASLTFDIFNPAHSDALAFGEFVTFVSTSNPSPVSPWTTGSPTGYSVTIRRFTGHPKYRISEW